MAIFKRFFNLNYSREWNFWFFLAFIALFAVAAAIIFIYSALNEEKSRMIASLHSRAESLLWSVEGAARFLRHSHRSDFASIISEMALQPGVAWIALVDADGKILLDSDPRLDGNRLYSLAEMKVLAPENVIKGRFSPDDPEVYETWKTFLPSRGGRFGREQADGASVLFVALDASGFNESLKYYALNAGFSAFCAILASLTFLALVYYARGWRVSREELNDARVLAELIIANYPAALILADKDFNIKYANREAESEFSARAGANLFSFAAFPPKSLLKELSRNGYAPEREIVWRDKNGETVETRALGQAVGDGKTYLFIFNNLSEINALKKKLAQERKLSAIGKLASGLAHEIRNPLSSICGYARYLAQKLADDPPALAAASLLEDEAQRLNGVLSDLAGLAKLPSLNLKKRKLAPILEKALNIIKPDADAKKINLTLNLDDAEAEVNVDADRLAQVLLNILLNAVQAAPETGAIELSLLREERALVIAIADNGPGISADVLEQIFTPYFSTKAKGSGLGLPLSQQIVESHGWTLAVTSVPNKGATFKIIIPDTRKNASSRRGNT